MNGSSKKDIFFGWPPSALIVVSCLAAALLMLLTLHLSPEPATPILEELATEVPGDPVQRPLPQRRVLSGTYNMGPLAGRRAGDLYARYLGYDPNNPIPVSIYIDWAAQLQQQWDLKLNRRHGVSDTARRASRELNQEYRVSDPGLTTLADYQLAADAVAQENCRELDWDSVRREYNLDVSEGRLLRRLSCNMRGRSLTAYAMTELLPSDSGNLNRDYFDFLLQHGGRRFVESLPAMYDEYTSFGPYQFTHYALYQNGNERRGSSRVNEFLPISLQIRDSVIYLRGDDHHRAAHLFVIHNLGRGISRLNSRQVATLERIGGSRGVDIVQYIAVAHNKPANGYTYLEAWLDDNGRRSFAEYCRASTSRGYARKTLNNYRALSPT